MAHESSAQEEAKSRLAAALLGKGAHLSFEQAVEGFPEALMNEKPPHVPYSFHHQLEHIRITQLDILEYIRTPGYESPPWPEGYWPPRNAPADSRAWTRTIDLYRTGRQDLVDLISDRDRDILVPVAHMEGRSILREVLLVIDHTAYHLGEFVMARQILGAWKSELG